MKLGYGGMIALQWNPDIMNCQGTGIMYLLRRGSLHVYWGSVPYILLSVTLAVRDEECCSLYLGLSSKELRYIRVPLYFM